MVCSQMRNRFLVVWLGVKIRLGYVIQKGVTFVYWEEGGSLVMVLAWGHRRRPVRSQVTPWGRLVGGREREGRWREWEGVGGEERVKLSQGESCHKLSHPPAHLWIWQSTISAPSMHQL